MAQDNLKSQIQQDMKASLKAGDKLTLSTIRLIMAAIKQKEVDERIELDDQAIISVLDKMSKQRNESIQQFRAANREDLADKEAQELNIIQRYLPTPLSTSEIDELIEQAFASTGASSMKDMGKLMSVLRPQLQGRADMSQVSSIIKQRLS